MLWIQTQFRSALQCGIEQLQALWDGCCFQISSSDMDDLNSQLIMTQYTFILIFVWIFEIGYLLFRTVNLEFISAWDCQAIAFNWTFSY